MREASSGMIESWTLTDISFALRLDVSFRCTAILECHISRIPYDEITLAYVYLAKIETTS